MAFIRWRGHGTGPKGAFELLGVDRLRVNGDRVTENIICFDTAVFAAVVGVALSTA